MVYFGSHDELVVDDIVRCVTHSEQGRCRVQMARHSSTAVHVLTNALKTGSLVEVSCNDKWRWLIDYYSKNAKALYLPEQMHLRTTSQSWPDDTRGILS